MDEQTTPTATKPDSGGTPIPVSTSPVMDVKPPAPAGNFGPPVQDASPTISPVAMPEPPAEATPEPPAEETPTMAAPAASEPNPTSSFGGGSYSSDTDPNQTAQTPVQPAQVAKKSGGKALKIILIVVIALALAGGATYFYLKNKKASESAKTDTTTANTQTTATPVTSKDVATASSNLDTALTSADSANDTAATDLTDATLGL